MRIYFFANTINLKNNSQQSFQQFSQGQNAENFPFLIFFFIIQKLFDAQLLKKKKDKPLQSQNLSSFHNMILLLTNVANTSIFD